jgi:hypothetical protein
MFGPLSCGHFKCKHAPVKTFACHKLHRTHAPVNAHCQKFNPFICGGRTTKLNSKRPNSRRRHAAVIRMLNSAGRKRLGVQIQNTRRVACEVLCLTCSAQKNTIKLHRGKSLRKMCKCVWCARSAGPTGSFKIPGVACHVSIKTQLTLTAAQGSPSLSPFSLSLACPARDSRAHPCDRAARHPLRASSMNHQFM